MIVSDICRQTGFTSRLLARGVPMRMACGKTLIACIAHRAQSIGQVLQQLGLVQQVNIGGGTRHTVRDIDTMACFFIDANLALERVQLLLAAVEALSGSVGRCTFCSKLSMITTNSGRSLSS